MGVPWAIFMDSSDLIQEAVATNTATKLADMRELFVKHWLCYSPCSSFFHPQVKLVC